MTKSTITREQLLEIIETDHVQCGEASYLARMALAAMDSETVELPLDYLQGRKDGLEWAAQLAEANHPETGDWLYDDPIELAKAIRKGPDMPPVQPVADSEPVAWGRFQETPTDGGYWILYDYKPNCSGVEPLYRHAQPAPVVPNGLRLALSNAGIAAPESDEMLAATCEKHIQALVTWVKDRKSFQSAPVVPDAYVRDERGRMMLNGVCEPKIGFGIGWNACRAAMLAAAPQSPGSEPATVPGKWIPVSERMPEEGGRYWCYVEEQNSLGKSHYQWNCSWNGDVWSDKALTGRVTHWMPLPAAPQEFKP